MTKYKNEWVDIQVKFTELNARVRFLEKFIKRLEGEIRSLSDKLTKEKEKQEAKRFNWSLLIISILSVIIAAVGLMKMLL